jgi:predicted component of type VI protein secretion system
MDVRLVAQTGCSRSQAVQVKAAKFFIGTHANCQLRPSIPNLGGVHSLVEVRDGRVFVRDFGAEGGTTINERVLRTKETEVFDGDLLQIGPMVLSFAISSKTSGVPLPALASAPEGWPFEDGIQETNVMKTPAVPTPPQPLKPSVPSPEAPPAAAPARAPAPAPL